MRLAENGLQALEALQEETPGLVILDLIMPQVDGFSAIRTIMAENPIPIVVVSGTDTAIGKTVVACSILRALRMQ